MAWECARQRWLFQTPSNVACEKGLTEKVAVDTATIGCLSRELDVLGGRLAEQLETLGILFTPGDQYL